MQRQSDSDSLSEIFKITIGDIAEPTPAVHLSTKVSSIAEIFQDDRLLGVSVVENGMPVGLVMKNKLFYHLGSAYGVSLYFSKPVERLVDRSALIVDSTMSLEAVSTLALARQHDDLYDLIIVVKDHKYLGTVSIIELLRNLTNMQIRHASNSNPLSGLPGNLLIEEKLKNLIAKDANFAVIYVDLDNFKAFNDKYGFEKGDQALLLTTKILNAAVVAIHGDSDDSFLGHIGGDDFVIITIPGNADDLCTRIIQRFDCEIRQLYSEEDLVRGYIVTLNRKGQEERFPILTISLAIVDTETRKFQNFLEVGEVAAEVKKLAKQCEASCFMRDRRENCRRHNNI